MENLKEIVAKTALKEMLRKGHLDICTIDKVIKILGTVPQGEAYRLLSALHCIDFKDMPKEILKGMPDLIQRAIGSIEIELDYVKLAPMMLTEG